MKRENEVCDCACHEPGATNHHGMPCCHECPHCHKNIKIALSTNHQQRCFMASLCKQINDKSTTVKGGS